MNAGSLIVSAVFQPIEAVSKSGEVTKNNLISVLRCEQKPSEQGTIHNAAVLIVDAAPLENRTETL